jgi:stage V sporulation protein D (sporulation-specific penicillin-binding protein)
VRVPDLAGMTVLEANKLLRSYGLELRVEGSGLATGQDPAPETEVNPSTVVTARFEPPAADGA